MTYADIVKRAKRRGILGMTAQALEDYEPESDGLSGGVSWFYSLFGLRISCHKAGVAHDWLYERGGTERDREKADSLFRDCAANMGSMPTDSWGKVVRAWRLFRANVMYLAVRLFGWLYWTKENS